MNISIKQIDLFLMSATDEQAVRQVLAESSHATVFHTIEWNRILVNQSGCEDVLLLALKDGCPSGIYEFFVLDRERCYSSLANMVSIYGGPISVDNDPEVISALLHAAETYKPFSSFHIWCPPKYDPLDISGISGMGYSMREIYQTPLWHLDCSEEDLWQRLDKDKRTKIRKTIREGLSAVEGDISLIDQYSRLVFSTLNGAVDARTREPIQLLKSAFYRQVVQDLVPLKMARMFLICNKEEFISGSIVLYFKNTVYAWNIGWRREFANLSPNDLLTWTIACHARSIGCKVFDLMVIDTSAQPGVAKWKRGFGVEVVPCHYFHKSTAANRILRAGRLAFTDFPALVQKVLKRSRMTEREGFPK